MFLKHLLPYLNNWFSEDTVSDTDYVKLVLRLQETNRKPCFSVIVHKASSVSTLLCMFCNPNLAVSPIFYSLTMHYYKVQWNYYFPPFFSTKYITWDYYYGVKY